MGQPDSLGLIAEGYFADLLLVNGNPTEDITVLQDHNKLEIIIKDGVFHKDLT